MYETPESLYENDRNRCTKTAGIRRQAVIDSDVRKIEHYDHPCGSTSSSESVCSAGAHRCSGCLQQRQVASRLDRLGLAVRSVRLGGVDHRPASQLGAYRRFSVSGQAVDLIGCARVRRLLPGRRRRPTSGDVECSTTCYAAGMAREITQRELRNDSGEIMRQLDEGESFIVTRNGVPVGELSPLRRHRFVRSDTAVALFRHAPAVDLDKLRDDLDRVVSQDLSPRG